MKLVISVKRLGRALKDAYEDGVDDEFKLQFNGEEPKGGDEVAADIIGELLDEAQGPVPLPHTLITSSEIAALAHVGGSTVSNWKRRYDDFPQPAGGPKNKPLYHCDSVLRWLRQRKLINEAQEART